MSRIVIQLETVTAAGEVVLTNVSDNGFVTPNGTMVLGLVRGEVSYSVEARFYAWERGQNSGSVTAINLINRGRLDFLLSHDVRNQPIRIYELADGENPTPSNQIGISLIDRIDATEGELVVHGYPFIRQIDRPLERETFDATLEFGRLDGLYKPIVAGYCENVAPIVIELANAADNIVYQYTALLGDVDVELINVKDGGALLDPGATPTPDYIAAEATGTMEITSPPVGKLTCTVAGGKNTPNEGAATIGEHEGRDALEAIGAFANWSGGSPEGWTVVVGTSGTATEVAGGINLTGNENTITTLTASNAATLGERFAVSYSAVLNSGVGVLITASVGSQEIEGAIGTFDEVDSKHLVIRVEINPPDAPGSWDITLNLVALRQAWDANLGQKFNFFAHVIGRQIGPLTVDAVLLPADDVHYNLFLDETENITALSLLEQAVEGPGWLYYAQGDGDLAVARLQPASNTPDLVLDARHLSTSDISRRLDRAPRLNARLGVNRNFSPHDKGTIAGIVDDQDGEKLAKPYLEIIELDDTEILDQAYRVAVDREPRDSIMRLDTALVTRHRSIMGLYGQLRYFWDVPDVAGVDPESVDIGGTVRLEANGLELSHGTDLLLVGKTRRLFAKTMDLILWGTAGRYRIDATAFGLTDVVALTSFSATDSNKVTVCCAIYSVDFSGSLQEAIRFTSDRFLLRAQANGSLRIYGENAAGTTIMDLSTADGVLIDRRYNWIEFAVDLSESSDEAQLYVNGRRTKLTVATYTDDSIEFSTTELALGNGGAPRNRPLDGNLTHVGILVGTKVDLDDRLARLRLFDIYGRPLDPGSDGTNLFGQPATFLFPNGRGPNLGTAGGSVSESLPLTATESPTDDSDLEDFIRYHEPAREFDNGTAGTAGYYRSTVVGVDSDKVSICCAFSFSELAVGNRWFFDMGSRGAQLAIVDSDQVAVIVENSSAAIIGRIDSTSLATDAYHVILAAIDVGTGEYHYYVNDEPSGTEHTAVATGETIHFSAGEQTIGMFGFETPGPNGFVGAVQHLGVATGVFLDFSQWAVRRRFFDRYHRPVFGGVDGSRAFGVQPQIWCPGGDGTRNAGTYGAMSLVTVGAGTVPLADTYATDRQAA